MVRRLHVTQYTFDKGILDEEVLGRRDIRSYAGGVLRADNMEGIVGGPVRRRGGLRHIDSLDDAGAGARLVAFQFRVDQTYLLVFTDRLVRIYRNDVEVNGTGLVTPFTAEQLSELDYEQSLDTVILVHRDVPPQRLQRQGSDTNWGIAPILFRNLPTHNFGAETTGTVTSSGTTGDITLTSDTSDFKDAVIGQTVRLGGGKAKITAKTSDSIVSARVEIPLDDTDAVAAADWSIEEDVWSPARGWPGSVHLNGNRSYWGGSRSLPQRVWGSSSGGVDIFDFLETKERFEDEYVEDDLVGSQVNAVGHVHSLGDLFFFSSGGLFVNTISNNSPVSLENFHVRRQSPTPFALVKPVASDGALTCVTSDGAGNSIGCADVVFDVDQDRYGANDLNTLSASVMRRPKDLAARFSDGVRSAHTRYVVNSDGTVAVHQSLRSENVKGWTLWKTGEDTVDEGFVNVAVVGNTPYFLVKRLQSGGVVHCIEKLSTVGLFDAATTRQNPEPSSRVTGLEHLTGTVVKVWADGAERDDALVEDGGITIRDGGKILAVKDMEVGLPVHWHLTPLPVEAQVADATLVGQVHRVIAVTLELFRTYPFQVNNRKTAFRRFDNLRLDSAASAYTGRHRFRLLGWDRGIGRSFSLSGYLPITLLSAVVEVSQ